MGIKNVDMAMSMDAGRAAYDLKDAVLAEAVKMGFSIPAQPMQMTETGPQPYTGTLPPKLTELTDEELGMCMSMLSAHIAFINTEKALNDVSYSNAKAQLEFVEAKLRLTYKLDEEGKKRTVQERDDLVKNDSRFIEANRTAIYYHDIHILMAAKCKEADQNFAAVSRRITQKGQEVGHHNRMVNVENQQPPRFPKKLGR